MAGVAYGATVSIDLDEDELLGVHLLATLEGVPDEDAAGFAGVLRATLRRGLDERLTAAGMEWPPTARAVDVAETVAGEATETADDAAAEDSARDTLRAVVIGATAAEAGLSAAEVARLLAFEDVQTVIAAALKLDPFDPALGVRWAAAAEGEVEAMVVRVAGLSTPAQIPAWSAPEIEEWGQRHRTSERRLFRA